MNTKYNLRTENNKKIIINGPYEIKNVNQGGERSENTKIDRGGWEAQTKNRSRIKVSKLNFFSTICMTLESQIITLFDGTILAPTI